MSTTILADCCPAIHGRENPGMSHLKEGQHVYLQIGSPPESHALAIRYTCDTCGTDILKIEEHFSSDQDKNLWEGDFI